jgi:hypothetical protein
MPKRPITLAKAKREIRELRQENDLLRIERDRAVLKVERLRDYLRVAVSIVEADDRQYTTPPEATPLAQAIADISRAARAAGLTDADIDAELAAARDG